MIQDFQTEGNLTDAHRILAVVAGRADQASEIAARFAAQGESVEALWYADSHQLLAEAKHPHFEAVILFADRDEEATNAAEADLRGGLVDTPLFRVG